MVDNSTSIFWKAVDTILGNWVDVLILRPFIWNRVIWPDAILIDPTKEQN
jgi:hypothetical protein